MLGRFQHDVIALKPEAVIVWGFNNNVHRSDRAPIGQTLKRTRGKPSVHGCIWRNRRGLPRFLPRKSLDERLEGLNMWIGAILAKDGY